MVPTRRIQQAHSVLSFFIEISNHSPPPPVDVLIHTNPGRDPALSERLQREVVEFVRLAEAVTPVCARTVTPAAQKRREEIVKALESESELQPSIR